MKFSATESTSGTSLQEYIDISYDDLVNVLGEPHSDGDGYKTDAEWDLLFEDGTIATIYNYKTGKNYLGAEGVSLKEERDWHIGGFDKDSVMCIKLIFKDAKIEKSSW